MKVYWCDSQSTDCQFNSVFPLHSFSRGGPPHQKSSPSRLQLLSNIIVTDADRIIHSQVISREHRAGLEFWCGFAAINNNSTPSRRFCAYNAMTNDAMYDLHVLLSERELVRSLRPFAVLPQVARKRRLTAFIDY